LSTTRTFILRVLLNLSLSKQMVRKSYIRK
jgi:hypothetical protein